MTDVAPLQNTVVRMDGGLFISGTRITVYDVMDYLAAGWSPEKIRQGLPLTEQQLTEVLAYIVANRSEIEAEYQLVLQHTAENQQYWEAQNRDRLPRHSAESPKPGHEAAWAKLQVWKAKLDGEC